MSDIDFIIPWVDGSDPNWLNSYNQFAPAEKRISHADAERYRDWGLLRYWFRGVEKFTPWVRTIHFVTCGQLPGWLNVDAPKLHHVKHEDYIPKEYLPVFSSHPIELNMHRIEGLSEKFVYFNDDTFIIRPLPVECFFQNGLPCDTAVCNLLQPSSQGMLTHIMANNMAIINEHFDKHEAIRKNWRKWLNLKYGTAPIRTLLQWPWPAFSNLYEHHQPNAFLKSTFDEVWQLYGERLKATSMTRLRSISNCSQWLMRDWQLVKGEFEPINVAADTHSYMLGNDNLSDILRDVKLQQKKMICINDNQLPQDQVENIRTQLTEAFESILPEKSSFEK